MTLSHHFDRLSSDPVGLSQLPTLVDFAISLDDQNALLLACAKTIHRETESPLYTAIVRGIKGTWRTLAEQGPSESAPAELMADSLDSEQFQSNGLWCASPLSRPNPKGHLLVQRYSKSLPDPSIINSLATATAIALAVFKERQHPMRRAERLSAMLEMTAQWNRSRETDVLLEEIAKTSTRLLSAERATIFLFDTNRENLVGKPALGVDGGQLVIPANAGVVGEVVQSGESRRVDSDIPSEQQQINRRVDEQLDFETRSLLCVPLFNSEKKTIGAFELINKIQGNFTSDDQTALVELAAHSAVAIENTKHVENLETTRRVVADEAAGQVRLIGRCAQLDQLKETIKKVANTDLAILITGENGTGKEVVAQLIHYLSNRRDEVLVAVNCAAITESLLESELFGHEKGAFTDAHQARAGKFELADQGTLFLDEIGDMSPGGQAKLLRVLEEKVVVRVGGSQTISTNARIVAATNQNLAQLVQDKKFREDLFFRLNVVTIELPSLRDRGDDIVELAEHFLKEFCAKARRSVPTLSPATKTRLLSHLWPGNVRELRNMMERLAYLSSGDRVEPGDLAFIDSPRSNESAVPMNLKLADATRVFQCDYIQKHIDRAGGNMTDAATHLGLHRSNLYRKMRQLEMDGTEDEEI